MERGAINLLPDTTSPRSGAGSLAATDDTARLRGIRVRASAGRAHKSNVQRTKMNLGIEYHGVEKGTTAVNQSTNN